MWIKKMQYKFMEIKPTDTVFFNRGVNTKMGTSNWIKSKTMPYLSVFYGALATALMRNGKLKSVLEEINSDNNQKKIDDMLDESLSIRGSYLTDGEKLFLPAPLDLFLDTDQRVYQGSYKNNMLWLPDTEKNFIDKLNTVEGYYISFADFINSYQKKKLRDIHLKGQSDFWTFYHKTGIEESKENRSAANGHLYINEQALFSDKKYAYVVQAACSDDDDELEGEYLLTLGGACKTALMRKMKSYSIETYWNEYINAVNETDKIKLIFISPFFMDIKEKDMFGPDVKILYKVTGKPEYIGGYNMAAQTEKQIKKAVPQGSVFVLQSENFAGKSFQDIHLELEEKLQSICKRGAGSFLLSEAGEE